IPDDGLGKTQCDSGDYTRTFDRCIAEFGWAEKARLNGQLIEGRYYGIGVACFIEGGGSGPREHARMAVESDGTIAGYGGSSAVGQGVEPVMGQIAADALHVPLSQVKVLHASTTYLRDGVGSFGSRATVMGGSAIVNAANNLIDALRAAAATRLDAPPHELRLGDGIVETGDGRRITWAELAGGKLSVEGLFESSRATYTYGTAAAHVAVDPR